jgi:hypothetical protein
MNMRTQVVRVILPVLACVAHQVNDGLVEPLGPLCNSKGVLLPYQSPTTEKFSIIGGKLVPIRVSCTRIYLAIRIRTLVGPAGGGELTVAGAGTVRLALCHRWLQLNRLFSVDVRPSLEHCDILLELYKSERRHSSFVSSSGHYK